jgi:hypothetical protein
MEFVSPAAFMKKLFGSNSSTNSTTSDGTPEVVSAESLLEPGVGIIESCIGADGKKDSLQTNPEGIKHEPIEGEIEATIKSHKNSYGMNPEHESFACKIEGEMTPPDNFEGESLSDSAYADSTETDNSMRRMEKKNQGVKEASASDEENSDSSTKIGCNHPLDFDEENISLVQTTESTTTFAQGSLESAETLLPTPPTPNEDVNKSGKGQAEVVNEVNQEGSVASNVVDAAGDYVALKTNAIDEPSAAAGAEVAETNGEMADSDKPNECEASNLPQNDACVEFSTVHNETWKASDCAVEEATHRLQTLAQAASAGIGPESTEGDVHKTGTDGEDGEAETEEDEGDSVDESDDEAEDGTEGSWAAVGALISGRRSERPASSAFVKHRSNEGGIDVSEKEVGNNLNVEETEGLRTGIVMESKSETGPTTTELNDTNSAEFHNYSEQPKKAESTLLETDSLPLDDNEGVAVFTNSNVKVISPGYSTSGNEVDAMGCNRINGSAGGLTAWIKNKVLGHQTPVVAPAESSDFMFSEHDHNATNVDEEFTGAEVHVDDAGCGSNTNVNGHCESAVPKTPRRAWTEVETEALRHGMAVHGHRSHKWARIKADPEFQSQLMDRTNVQLKDRWRSKTCNLMESRADFLANKKTKFSPSQSLLRQQPSQHCLQQHVHQPSVLWTATDLMVPEALLGQSVRKELVDGCIDGVVTAYVEPYWEITYVDGEEEDLDQNEVLSLLNSTFKLSQDHRKEVSGGVIAGVVTTEFTSSIDEV